MHQDRSPINGKKLFWQVFPHTHTLTTRYDDGIELSHFTNMPAATSLAFSLPTNKAATFKANSIAAAGPLPVMTLLSCYAILPVTIAASR